MSCLSGIVIGMRLLRSAVVTASIPLVLLGGGWAALADGDEVEKTPKQILVDLQRDMGKVRSYHVVTTAKQKGAVFTMSGDIFASGSASITIGERRGAVRMIQLPKALYLKASASYWRSVGGKNGNVLARKLAGRWVRVPASVAADVKPLMTKLSPKYFASCVTLAYGTIVNNGIKMMAGRRAIELEYKGDRPGATPALFYVTADGPVLPLRSVQTGPRKPGGKIDKRCDDADARSSSSEITFSRFNAVPPLRAPRGALKL
jgi:hypothetical protein